MEKHSSSTVTEKIMFFYTVSIFDLVKRQDFLHFTLYLPIF
jgi:hypothetical protein